MLIMFIFMQKYSMSSKAEISVFAVNTFPIFSACPSRSPAVQLAVVVTTGLLFLDQFTAIAWKYVGTSRESSRLLMSLWAMSAFFLSVSGIGGLNCSINR